MLSLPDMGGGLYASYRRSDCKIATGDVYTGVSYFCALVQEQSNLKPYA